jgi:trehalose 6-phosphate synthase
MARLVIVSNRVPVPGDRSPAAGGLATALADAITPGSLWFGWSGRRTAEPPGPPHITESGGVTYATIDIAEESYRRFYTGFSNSTLYPLLLYRLGLVSFHSADYVGYRAVNRAFAEMLAPLLRDDDMIWIHDYQLIPLGEELRRLGVGQRIGFFLHTPFVPPPLFAALPRARELLAALCACDVVGFHTDDYRAAFLACVADLLGHRADTDGRFRHAGRVVQSVVAPVGIDVAGFAAAAARAAAGVSARQVAASLTGSHLAISVDRLDYAKGLPNRIEALDHLFAGHPEHRRHLTFLQVAAPSREELGEYRSLRREVDRAVGDINGRYGAADWTPIRYLTRQISRGTLAGFHRLARLGVVTPLRDGMNLVAKEFIAAQNPADPGVLILSRFAGAAEDLQEALIVNPFEAEAIAEAMHRGLTMTLEERRERQRALLARIEASSARAYCRRFLTALAAARPEPATPVLEAS